MIITIQYNVLRHCSTDYKDFEYILTPVLNKNAREKKKVIQGNHKPHFNKEVTKARSGQGLMLRSRLKNKASKTKNDVYISAHLIDKTN